MILIIWYTLFCPISLIRKKSTFMFCCLL